jgi:hypothetical protein
LPELEREVNQGKNFASLRQIYHSLILAAWYKKKIRDSILHRVYVDQRKVSGLENGDATIKDRIYQRYLEAFQKGAYSIIKEEENPDTHELVPRKYFSGGVDMTNLDTSSALIIEAQSSASSSIDDAPDSVVVQTRLKPTDRQQILEIIADDFEKPTVKYAVKPEREMNEKVVERNAAVEIQLELE